MIEHELKGKRILVTGANGFIGAKLVKALFECGSEVVALVDEESNLARLQPLASDAGLRILRCSLNDMRSLIAQKRQLENIELVAHLALYMPRNTRFSEQCTEDINLNLLTTINLLRVIGTSLQGICFASSVSVYGAPARLPVREEDVPLPVSSYGVTKLAIEHYLRAWGKTNNVPVTILRYATVYGPGELNHRAIPKFLQAIGDGKPPLVNGDGSELRDYVYVDDVVQATVRALAKKPARVLNIGSGHSHSSLQIAKEIIRLYPADIEPQIQSRSQNGQKRDIICDISAAKEALDYTPLTGLGEGLTKEINWYRNEVLESGHHFTSLNERRAYHNIYCRIKSVVDRILSFVLIIVLSPLLIFLATGIRLESPGNPIFRQERVGKDGRIFKAYKFRSMYANNDDSEYKAYLQKYVLENAPYRVDENGNGIYKCNGSGVTRFGALLRKTNLDELPQLFNVLKGEMFIIGPRPDVPFAVAMYQEWQRERLKAKPGITGLWQVCGRKGLSFEDMVRLDIEYIQKQSLLLDTRILLHTARVILWRDGS